LIAILFFAFVTRIYRLDQPKTYVFDEVYHAVTAKLIAQNDPRAYEWWNPEPEPNTAVDWLHPPYAKYAQAASILVFGENSFGWRFSSVVFGVGVIWLTAVLSQALFANKQLALTAAGLASLDGLLLTQSRIAMNDIQVTFFILAALTCYVFYRQKSQLTSPGSTRLGKFFWLLLTGIMAGLALGTKWSGLFVIATIGLFEAVSWLQLASQKKTRVKLSVLAKQALASLLALIIIPASLYVGAYSHMFWQGKDLTHLKELHQQIIWYQTNLEATHSYQSRPWQWFLNARPVWFYVDHNPLGEGSLANIYALGNPAIFWLGDLAIILTIFVLIRKLCLRLMGDKTKFESLWALAFTVIAYGLVWLPWVLSPRIMFFYHYTPAVPLLCIILAFWLIKLINLKGKWQQPARLGVTMALGLMGLVFLVWYPHWTALPVPTWFAETVYFAVPSWK
jgi:dolichyl-phosphate-mannose--protein O-mannosyl transferase